MSSIKYSGFKYLGRRKKMVELLHEQGLYSSSVLDALLQVPREYFMEPTLIELSYDDKAYPIACGQTISQPSTVALQTELLSLRGGEKVLEVGTGSGYQTAVLCSMGCEVYTIERQSVLYKQTSVLLHSLGYDAHCLLGDGFEGSPQNAPFDRILVTAGASQLPESLLHQLKVGGIAVMPVELEGKLKMLRLSRLSDTNIHTESFGDCSFVPMLKGVVE